MQEYLKAKITKIEPGAGYKDAVYEQTVVIELPSGKQMGIFDSLPKGTPELVGRTKDLVILAFIPKIVKISKTEPRIEPSSDNPLDWKNHSFYGLIEEIGVEYERKKDEVKYKNLVLLDVGVGRIFVEFDKELLTTVQKGDYIKVSALRTDLLDIH